MEEIKTSLLKPNPLNKNLYGDEVLDADLVSDIKEKGILSPIIVTRQNVIISGHTRWKIALKLNLDTVPVEYMDFATDAEADLALISFNKARNKSFIQMKNENDAIESIRKTSGMSTGSAQMADSLNLSKGGYHRRKFLWDAMDKGDEFAKNQAKLIEEGRTTIDKAYQKLCDRNNELRVREARKEQASLGEVLNKVESLYVGDFQEVLNFIPDNTVDAIITDPPYPREFLDCWLKLGEFAAKKLRPGGWLVAYSGQMFLPDVMARLEKSGLKYYWTMALYHNGTKQDVWGIDLNVMWKPVIVYVKPYPDSNNAKPKLDVKGKDDYLISDKEEKGGHDWQQSESSVAKLISTFTTEGDFIVEPFAGSGTTLVVAHAMNRKVVGAELDVDTYNISKARLKEAGL